MTPPLATFTHELAECRAALQLLIQDIEAASKLYDASAARARVAELAEAMDAIDDVEINGPESLAVLLAGIRLWRAAIAEGRSQLAPGLRRARLLGLLIRAKA